MNDRIRGYYPSVLYYFLLLLIFLFSFLNFSYRFYPLLNSDMAINILMTPGYQMPRDLYAWGQDRGGTLIPLLSHFLIRLVPISPVSGVSVVHYLILILGFLASASLFRARTTRLLLALMWFFPPWHFTDLVLFPFGTQFSLVMVGAWLCEKQENPAPPFFRHLLLAFSCMIMILAVWVSDLGILMVLLLGFLAMFRAISQKERVLRPGRILQLLHILLWMLLGTAFILYAKSTAARIDVYTDQPFNNTAEIVKTVTIISRSVLDVFTFSSENFVESIYAWLLMTGIPVLKLAAIPGSRGWHQRINKRWAWFFLLNGILTFLVMVMSHWAFLNGVGRRYFVLVYISFAMVVLFVLETFGKRNSMILHVLVAVIISAGTISSCYKFYYPRRMPSRISVLSEFQALGNAGIIAEYWNAYLSAASDPYRIKATPHDKDYVRNIQLADEVFEQPAIYVIKDMWMDSFPDTLHQFGRILVKKGEQFYIGRCWLNKYEIPGKTGSQTR